MSRGWQKTCARGEQQTGSGTFAITKVVVLPQLEEVEVAAW